MTKSSASNHLRRCTAAVAGLLVSIVGICVGAPGVFAMPIRLAPDDSGAAPVVHSATPTWEIALIAIGVAVALGLATLAAVAMVRGRSTTRVQRALS